MSDSYDAIVIGLGGMGSAAVCHLARGGISVVGIDQFHPPHDRGSSHGKSRIIRQAYFEGVSYVPLVMRAYELWLQLEVETGQALLSEIGGLMIGNRSSKVIKGSIRSAQDHHVDHVVLDAEQIRAKFPQFSVDSECVGLYEKKAGVLNPEHCVRAHLELASRCGASLRFDDRVISIRGIGMGSPLVVATNSGHCEAERIVLCGGPWTTELLTELNIPLIVERQIMHWFDPGKDIDAFSPSRFPLFVWEHGDGVVAYGVPGIDGPLGGVKFAFHNGYGMPCTPETISKTVTVEEIELADSYLRKHIPSLAGKHLESVTCMYTLTPDGHFIIDFHPTDNRVVIAAGFSGHGFKFASVVGEVLAEMTIQGTSKRDLSTFSIHRNMITT